MATVENVQLCIEESAEKSGYSIISYSYEMYPDESDLAEQHEYTVTVGLWGEDVIDDDVLATDLDEHQVTFDEKAAGQAVKVKRSFEVETKILDEDLIGDDEVYLIVQAHYDPKTAMELNSWVIGKSNTVVGDF